MQGVSVKNGHYRVKTKQAIATKYPLFARITLCRQITQVFHKLHLKPVGVDEIYVFSEVIDGTRFCGFKSGSLETIDDCLQVVCHISKMCQAGLMA